MVVVLALVSAFLSGAFFALGLSAHAIEHRRA